MDGFQGIAWGVKGGGGLQPEAVGGLQPEAVRAIRFQFPRHLHSSFTLAHCRTVRTATFRSTSTSKRGGAGTRGPHGAQVYALPCCRVVGASRNHAESFIFATIYKGFGKL